MEACIKRHILPDRVLAGRPILRVLDVGGAEINGSYRPLFASTLAAATRCEYLVSDIAGDTRLNAVQADPYQLPFHDGGFDVVISGQTFEHCEFFWLLFKEMARVCSPEGVIILIAPSAGAIHRYPVDCYRFLPDSCQALARYAGLELVESWRDERGPFYNVVGVFRSKEWRRPVAEAALPVVQEYDAFTPHPDAAYEVMRGAAPTSDFLQYLHQVLEPRFYLEIGVFMGASLQLANCPALGIDPAPCMGPDNPLWEKIVVATSDDYFFDESNRAYQGMLDLVYIDGMHLIENVIKDFINIEARSHPGTIIVLDDIYPNHPVQARRERETLAWTGDVWKIVQILRDVRPDLELIPVDTYPAGTLIVLGADAGNQNFSKGFDFIVDSWQKPQDPPQDVLQRKGALHPSDPVIGQLLSRVKTVRCHAAVPADMQPVRTFYHDSLPRMLGNLL
ncbi:methyltransferase domain-containing protein [Trichlorobacter lovleyi]|nr:methyltransferase domain-containing protein [Trichlorobacter lovleyi]